MPRFDLQMKSESLELQREITKPDIAFPSKGGERHYDASLDWNMSDNHSLQSHV
jgi:hypothetical protein